MAIRGIGLLSTLLTVFFFTSPPALSYPIAEHLRLTKNALREHHFCFNGNTDFVIRDFQDLVVAGNRDEDTNLFRKWLHYSHYFHPTKDLETFRHTSDTRIQRLMETIQTAIAEQAKNPFRTIETPLPKKVYLDLGRLIHHLQDSTVPAHVVPVNHHTTDGFEAYRISESHYRRTLDQSVCQDLDRDLHRDYLNPNQSLVFFASETLQSLLPKFTIQKNGTPELIDWSYYWKNPNPSGFGSYGVLKNNFGKSEFRADGNHYLVDSNTYHQFKLKQLRRAVMISRLALLWLEDTKSAAFGLPPISHQFPRLDLPIGHALRD